MEQEPVLLKKVIIRKALQSDAAPIIELVKSVAGKSFGRYGNEKAVRTWQAKVSPRFSALFERDDVLVLAAYLSGEPIATAFIEQRGKEAYLGGAYSARPGTGTGKELIRRRLAWARERPDVNTITTDVFADSCSVLFWESLGLEVIGEYISNTFPGAKLFHLGASSAAVHD